MKRETTNLQSRLYILAAVILLAGLGSAAWIYLAAGADSDDALGYESEGGYVYPVAPEDSKMYQHNLELYGGKVNVLANDLVRWFAGLWRGRSLAYTVACISVILAFAFFFAANHLQSGRGPHVGDNDGRNTDSGRDHP